MLIRIPLHDADTGLEQPRRGATAMEYLMMMSLIIVVALVGIGAFGSSTKNLTTSAADAIAKSLKQ